MLFTASRIVIRDPFKKQLLAATSDSCSFASLLHENIPCATGVLFVLTASRPAAGRDTLNDCLPTPSQTPLTARAALPRYRSGDSPIAGRLTPSSSRLLQGCCPAASPSVALVAGVRPIDRVQLKSTHPSRSLMQVSTSFAHADGCVALSRARCASSTERKRVKSLKRHCLSTLGRTWSA